MGAQSKEGVQLNRKSGRIGRRGGGGGNPDGDRTTVLLRHDKSLIPNYLKPTISSCGSNICQYPTSQQLPGPCPGRKSVIAKAPLSSFSPSPKEKEKEKKKKKERSIHNVSSFLSKPSKPVSSDKLAQKPSPLIKNVMNAPPKLRKSTRKRNLMSKETRSGTSKRREGNKVDIISSSARKKKAEVNNDNDNEEKHEVIEYEGSKNSGETKPRTPTRAKATSLSDEDEIKMVVKSEEFGNREDEKERSRCCNKVIAETIKRQVAERRRNNVRALVGAFETVISLESQLSTKKGEETKFTTIITRARARAGKDFESRIGGQHNHEEEENRRETDDGDKEGKNENLEDDQIGQQSQQEETKVEVFVEGQQSEEEEEESKTEANQWTTESDKEDEVIEEDESKSNTTEKNNDENKLVFSTEVKAIESVDN